MTDPTPPPDAVHPDHRGGATATERDTGFVGTAIIDADGQVTALDDAGRAVPCASVLKPIYAWVTSSARWTTLAAHMIVRSNNAATDTLVHDAGGLDALLVRIEAATGIHLEPGPTWGKVPVDAGTVAALYASLNVAARTGDRAALATTALMRNVKPPQDLGVSARWGQLRHRPAGAIATKAGWDLDPDGTCLYTHAVALAPNGSVALCSAVPVDDHIARLWRLRLSARTPEAVLGIHRARTTSLFDQALEAADRALAARP